MWYLPFLEKINKWSSFLFVIILVLFATFLFQDIFMNFNALGDESKYLSDLIKANQYGLGKAILDGTSISYLITTFYVNEFIGSPILSLKITSSTIGILTFLLLVIFNKKFLRITSPLKNSVFLWIAYLFVIQATIFIGVNDILLDFFGSLMFISLIFPIKSDLKKVILVSIFLALMLITRKMAVTYIFVFFLLYFILAILAENKSEFNLKIGLWLFLSFSIFFLTLNFYSLIEQKNPSFDDKILKGNVNWAQWDYHNALLIDQGVQKRFQHVNIQETEKYIKENGINSLPSTFLEMIFFDPILTVKEFFIDIGISLKYLIRQTGLMVFAFFILLLSRLKKICKTNIITPTDFVYLFSLLYFLIINFIVIANIQGRWFMLFLPIMILLIAKDLNKLPRQNQLFFSILNNILLIIMCLPYLIDSLNDFL